ncbi:MULTISPECIES: cytochrome b/b6 domain-containing protein [Asticcacaulis]|uniref:cytochrome b/b6 domain-containing protein n=1 Tax=Asticcacaulis TaxID=76890 RepID=UPI001AE20861|nr:MULTISPECIES: cytochrome b/b6 domain-containing protein [Asticcacaulis]MBP2158844.1 cytochrome b561/polyisoprenoid-binding protein YceI [Asticcacaulis solisilvae]MDR6799890.1 cytochrome b561/polyisoprenoid-binding protein YceI [Asticcacaulis sp. BE141]
METASYNRYSRWLHWLIAFLILLNVFLGWRLDAESPWFRSIINLHKSIGISILLLTFVRIAVRLAYKAPPEPPMPKWQALAAKTLHLGFYVVMIAMPLSGWLMVSTSARPIPFFFMEWFHLPVPQGDAPNAKAIHETFEAIHNLVAKLLIYGMIPLHVLAALKHQLVDKDNLLEHMVPGLKSRPIANWRWIVPLGVILLAVGIGYGVYNGKPKTAPAPQPAAEAVASAEAETGDPVAEASVSVAASASVSETASAMPVARWTVDKSVTKISFSTVFQGETVTGAFPGYTADIAFDPEQLDKSRVKVTIDLASVTASNNDYADSLKGASFFDTANFAKAVFDARKFEKTGGDKYVAHGRLTLHGVTKAVDLPFTLTIKDGVAQMKGSTNVDRIAHGVGSGEWASTDEIPAKIKVDITLKAKSK